ncbi:MAG: methylaspartate mutase [Armatimonadetes bacterium]|nr:methylaspartate mutase [Armatimonadota bacterium]
MDPSRISSILATDCGSTTTKAILIERVDGEFRLQARGEAPTTVEAPYEDVTRGVLNAVREVEELSGRAFLEEGAIVRPGANGRGADAYLSTSSAGGGLQMTVVGLVRRMTAESAERAALGAGAIVMDTIARDDGRRPHERIRRLRDLRPDMVLVSGGVDNGEVRRVVEMAELVAAASPKARLGEGYELPVIYAGNVAARGAVEDALRDMVALTVTDNLRPQLERENLGPARHVIQDLFLEHVMAHAPGYRKLVAWTDAPIMPTPAAVGAIMQTIAEEDNLNVVGVDIGGATTDVFSVFGGQFNRTVSANLGMSYSISNVYAEAGAENILRWAPDASVAGGLANRIRNKMIRPTSIPQTLDDLQLEQAVAREALRLAFEQHKSLATGLKGVQQERTISDTFEQRLSGETIVNMMELDLLVGSGGVLSHAPRRAQAAMMLIDGFSPEGVTQLAVDSIFMMPQLGVLAGVHREAATHVFRRDCLIRLGTCVACTGQPKLGQPAFSVTVDGQSTDVPGGEIVCLPLAAGETARLEAKPARGLDLGAGRGKSLTTTVHGGEVGLILDGRGRPIQTAGATAVEGWLKALKAYPG